MINKKNNFFWYFVIPMLVFVTLLISLSPWLFELAATPVDRVFSGINRWSVDYYIYLSYVELGKRGEFLIRLLLTTIPHQPIFTHLAYTIPGLFMGKILGLNSVFIYHFMRSLYGLLFLICVILLFYKLSRSRIIALLAFFLTFYVAGFPVIASFNPLAFSRPLAWIQEQNIISRPTGPLHYSLGFVFFILAFVWFFWGKITFVNKTIIFGLLLNLILLTNPFSFIVIAFSFGLYFLLQIIFYRNNLAKIKKELLTIFIGFLFCLPLILYFNHELAKQVWGKTGMAPKYYTVLHPPIYLKDVVLSIGPTFFLAILGIMAGAINKIKTNLNKSQFVFLLSWLIAQFFLLFFGDRLKIDPVRSFNGLYYLPLSYFSAVFIFSLVNQQKIFNKYLALIVCAFTFFLTTLPNYCLSYKDLLFAFTDFKSFQLLSFPSKKQVEAFSFLEKNTGVASGVMAMYEASSLIMGFSGNAAELGMDHQTKTRFYANQMSDKEAYRLLKTNHFHYVYFGYQEKSVGGNLEKYPFLKKIFQNEEATVYGVLYTTPL